MAKKRQSRKVEEYGLLSLVPTPVVVVSTDYDIRFINDAGLRALGKTQDKLIGKKCYDLFKTEVCGTKLCGCTRAIKEKTLVIGETKSEGLDNAIIKYSASPLRDKKGKITGCVESIFDITELKELKDKSVQLAKEILETATPIVTVLDDILTVPIIGTLDSDRTQRMMESLLQAVVDTQSQVVIIDVTGVPVIDTLTATHLIKTASAVRLLGATAIITGISPTIAQTLVTLGVDLSQLTTKAGMIDGIKAAFKLLGKKIVDSE